MLVCAPRSRCCHHWLCARPVNLRADDATAPSSPAPVIGPTLSAPLLSRWICASAWHEEVIAVVTLRSRCALWLTTRWTPPLSSPLRSERSRSVRQRGQAEAAAGAASEEERTAHRTEPEKQPTPPRRESFTAGTRRCPSSAAVKASAAGCLATEWRSTAELPTALVIVQATRTAAANREHLKTAAQRLPHATWAAQITVASVHGASSTRCCAIQLSPSSAERSRTTVTSSNRSLLSHNRPHGTARIRRSSDNEH